MAANSEHQENRGKACVHSSPYCCDLKMQARQAVALERIALVLERIVPRLPLGPPGW